MELQEEFKRKYSARPAEMEPRLICKELGVDWEEFQAWLDDPGFVVDLNHADAKRLWEIREIFFRNLPEIAANLASIASQRQDSTAIKASQSVMAFVRMMMMEQRGPGRPKKIESASRDPQLLSDQELGERHGRLKALFQQRRGGC